MNIKNFITGGFQTNTYLVWDENKTAYIFDCEGEGINRLVDFVRLNGLDVKYIILTHGHSDHICGLNALKNVYPDAKVFIGEEDSKYLGDSSLNHSTYIFGFEFVYLGTFKSIHGGEKIGDFEVIATPGHTMGGKCFYNKESNMLISGDTMFRRSFGRYDFPESDGKKLFDSLRRLCRLPDNTVVYSGHTESTTIGEEKVFLTSLGIL